MEVNPQPPPLSLAPWPRISCQSWAADTQLCSNNHTAWTQCMNVCTGVCVCISVRAHFCVWGHMKAWYLCVCMSGFVWVSFLYVLPDSICHPPPPLLLYNPISAGIKIWLWRALKQQSALSTGRNSSRLRATDTNTQTHTFRSSAPGLMVVPGAKRWITND